jgi:uncharacterized cupredoxin-like copper-binding protein
VLLYGLSTGHKAGLAIVAAVFIGFALCSSFLFPRFRAHYPGGGLHAFVIVAFVFFFGMLTAVEVFGAEPKETKGSQRVAETKPKTPVAATTTTATATTQTATAATQTTLTATTTQAAPTTTARPKPLPKPQTIQVTETEFKITLASPSLDAGKVTFQIRNAGKVAHDLTIAGGTKSKLIPPGGSATLQATLTSGSVELYCSVPGHKQLGMDLKTKVS